jgi:hypothetical protein
MSNGFAGLEEKSIAGVFSFDCWPIGCIDSNHDGRKKDGREGLTGR